MNFHVHTQRLLLTFLVAAATLVMAAPRADAYGIGADLSRDGDLIHCPEGPCTIAIERSLWSTVTVPAGYVITSWSAQLQSGTQARLRLLRRNGSTYTSVGQSDVVTAPGGGVQTFGARVPVGVDATVAIDLLSGAVGAVADEDSTLVSFVPPFAAGETRNGDQDPYDLMLRVEAEYDADRDGLGDDTQDDCVLCAPEGGDGGGRPGGGSGGEVLPGGGGSADGGGSHPDAGSYSSSDEKRPEIAFELDKRALLGSGRTGYVTIYGENTGHTNLKGKLTVKLGKTTIGAAELEVDWADDTSFGNLRLPKSETAKVLRTGRTKVSVSGTLRGENGKSIKVNETVNVLRGGASGFDGTYRAPGPVLIVVERGLIRNVSAPMNLFCVGSKKFMLRSMGILTGFPAMVGKDGSFSAKGGVGFDTYTYRGKLKPKGVSTGYISLFRSELQIGEGARISTDTCFDAKNWKAKRD